VINNSFLCQSMLESTIKDDDEEWHVDHRKLPRGKRCKFKHGEALACISRDYLSPSPLFGKEFVMMIRISSQCFQKLLEDVGNSGSKFYLAKRDAFDRETASLEARLLLPLSEDSCIWSGASLLL
jgi:hypothetical protein